MHKRPARWSVVQALTVRSRHRRPTALNKFGAREQIAPSDNCPEACGRTVSQLHGHCSSEQAGDHSFWSRREASAQAELVSVLRSHSHLTSQAQRIRRSGIPRPPFSLGAHTMRHATRHFPPVIDSCHSKGKTGVSCLFRQWHMPTGSSRRRRALVLQKG